MFLESFPWLGSRLHHGRINYLDAKAKCRHLKTLTCWGIFLWQVFIRVYRLEIQSVMLVFSTQFCELLPLSPSLWFNSTSLPSSLCEKIYCVNIYCIVCKGGGGMRFWASNRQKPAAMSLYRRIFGHFALPSESYVSTGCMNPNREIKSSAEVTKRVDLLIRE